MRKYLFFIGSCLAVSQPTWAQDNDVPGGCGDDCDRIVIADRRIDPITVTANGMGTALNNTGQAVTVIDTAEIDSLQGADITRVLQRAPGVTITRNGGVGSVTGVNVRGANADQLLVLVDGVPVADPASPAGGFDFGNLLAGMAGRIDLTRGSNSVIWGSDAIGGVIDISTRRDTGVRASAEYGARDTLFLRSDGGLSGDRYFVGLSGSYFRTDGFSAAANGTEPDGFEQVALGGSAFVDVTDSLEAFVRGEWSDSELDIDGFPAPAFTLADTGERQETDRYAGAAGFNFYGNDLTVRAAYSFADTERANFDPALGNAPTFASDGHSQQVLLRGEYRLVGGLTLGFGGEHEWSDFETTFDAPASTHSTGGYVQLGWAMGKLAAHLGGRVEDHQRYGTQFTYGADVSYGLGQDWRLRASLGEGFKAPTLYQLYSFFGDPLLEPEQSTSFDIGIEKGRRDGGLYVALTAFRRDSEQLIDFGFTAARPSGVYVNVGRARAQGIEAEAGYELAPGLYLAGVYSLVDTENRTSGNDLARRPRHAATLYADWESDFGLSLGADLRIVSGSWDNAANTVRLDAYEVVGLRAAFSLGERLELFGRVENLFDTDYQTAAGYRSTPRGVFAGIRAAM